MSQSDTHPRPSVPSVYRPEIDWLNRREKSSDRPGAGSATSVAAPSVGTGSAASARSTSNASSSATDGFSTPIWLRYAVSVTRADCSWPVVPPTADVKFE